MFQEENEMNDTYYYAEIKTVTADKCGDTDRTPLCETYEEACMEAGIRKQMHISNIIYEIGITKVVFKHGRYDPVEYKTIMKISERQKEAAQKWVCEDRNVYKICAALRRQWSEMHNTIEHVDNYLYSGGAL